MKFVKKNKWEITYIVILLLGIILSILLFNIFSKIIEQLLLPNTQKRFYIEYTFLDKFGNKIPLNQFDMLSNGKLTGLSNSIVAAEFSFTYYFLENILIRK